MSLTMTMLRQPKEPKLVGNSKAPHWRVRSPCKGNNYKDTLFFYKNVEAEINQNFKNILRTLPRLRVS